MILEAKCLFHIPLVKLIPPLKIDQIRGFRDSCFECEIKFPESALSITGITACVINGLIITVPGITIRQRGRITPAVTEGQIVVGLRKGHVIDVVFIPRQKRKILKGQKINFEIHITEGFAAGSRSGHIPCRFFDIIGLSQFHTKKLPVTWLAICTQYFCQETIGQRIHDYILPVYYGEIIRGTTLVNVRNIGICDFRHNAMSYLLNGPDVHIEYSMYLRSQIQRGRIKSPVALLIGRHGLVVIPLPYRLFNAKLRRQLAISPQVQGERQIGFNIVKVSPLSGCSVIIIVRCRKFEAQRRSKEGAFYPG